MSGSTEGVEKRVLRRWSIAAGVAYLYGILYGVAVGLPISSKLIVAGDAAATSANITAHEMLFRLNTLAELLMYVAVIVLAVALYVITRQAGRNLAVLGLSLRVVEGALSCTFVIAGYGVLEVLSHQAYLGAFTPQQRQAAVQVLLNLKIAGGRITPLFFCIGSILFYGLLLKSRGIPRVISALGILAYALFLVDDVVSLLTPGSSSTVVLANPLEIAVAAPVILFEAFVGVWLVVRGVRPPTA